MPDPKVTARLKDLTAVVLEFRKHIEADHDCRRCHGDIHRVESEVQRLADAIHAEVEAASIFFPLDEPRHRRFGR